MTIAEIPQTKSRFHPDGRYSYTLPAHYYFDPAIYEQEKNTIWYRTWQFVGCAEDLKEPGSYITAMVMDQPVFVVRTKDGDLRAYYNVCRHRGHLLLEEPKGQAVRFTCPFHAWTYGHDGRLRGAPNAENIAGFKLQDFSLRPIRVEIFGHWVWVNLDDDAAPMSAVFPGLLDDINKRIPKFDQLQFVRKDTFEVNANWKFILDGLECYHCPYIHPQIMGTSDGYVTTTFFGEEHECWSSHFTLGNYEMMDHHKEKLPYDMGAADLRDILIWFMWPNIVLVAHQGPSNIKLLQAAPQTPESSKRHMYNFCVNNPPTATDLGHMNQYRDIAWPQDRKAMEMQALGIKSRGYQQGRLMVDAEHSWRSEHGTHHFQNLVWKSLNGENY